MFEHVRFSVAEPLNADPRLWKRVVLDPSSTPTAGGITESILALSGRPASAHTLDLRGAVMPWRKLTLEVPLWLSHDGEAQVLLAEERVVQRAVRATAAGQGPPE